MYTNNQKCSYIFNSKKYGKKENWESIVHEQSHTKDIN